MKKITLLFLLSLNNYAFTLVSNPAVFFPDPNVEINVSNTSCANIGITTEELMELTINAMDHFWNSVATSSIDIAEGGIINAGLAADYNHDAGINAANSGTILVGCSTNIDLDGLGGIGGIDSDGTNVKGSLRINNRIGTPLANYTDEQLETLIAHEVGHTIGIHHSADPAALMYYAPLGVQEELAEDDIDAVTYLYPNEASFGCVGAIGSIATIKNDPPKGPPGNWILSLFLGMATVFLIRFKNARQI